MTKRYHFMFKQLLIYQTLHVFLTKRYTSRRTNLKNDSKLIKLEDVIKEVEVCTPRIPQQKTRHVLFL